MALVNGTLTVGGYLDLQKNELRNSRLQNLASDPSSPVMGQEYFNTGSLRRRTFNGTTWDEDGGGGDFSSNTATSVDSEMVLFSGTGGKTGKRATLTAAVVKSTAGVLEASAAGTDFLAPAGSGAALTGITQSQVASLTSDLALKSPLASPTFTGTPAAPTATGGTNTTQVATTAFVSTAVGGVVAAADALVFKGGVDCSANPNYPAADAGWVYKVTVAGKIGGASGPNVEAGDTLTCTVDSSAGGTHASVGADWIITQTNLDAATTSIAGFVSLATQAEAEAGSVSTKALTPASMVGFGRTYSALCGNGADGTSSGDPLIIPHNLALADRDAYTWSLKLRSSHDVELAECTSIDANSIGLWGWSVAPASDAYYITVQG